MNGITWWHRSQYYQIEISLSANLPREASWRRSQKETIHGVLVTELENDNIVSRRQEPLCQMASKQDDPPEGWGRYSTFRTIKLQKCLVTDMGNNSELALKYSFHTLTIFYCIGNCKPSL